jgi:hypothetical protein
MTDFDDNNSGGDRTRETTVHDEQENKDPHETSMGNEPKETSSNGKKSRVSEEKEKDDSEPSLGDSEPEQENKKPSDVNMRWKNWYHNKGGKERIAEQRTRKRQHDKMNKEEIDNFKMSQLVKMEWKQKNEKLKHKKDKWKGRFRELKHAIKENPPQNEENQIKDNWGKPIYF